MPQPFTNLLPLDFWKSVHNLVRNRVFPKTYYWPSQPRIGLMCDGGICLQYRCQNPDSARRSNWSLKALSTQQHDVHTSACSPDRASEDWNCDCRFNIKRWMFILQKWQPRVWLYILHLWADLAFPTFVVLLLNVACSTCQNNNFVFDCPVPHCIDPAFPREHLHLFFFHIHKGKAGGLGRRRMGTVEFL